MGCCLLGGSRSLYRSGRNPLRRQTCLMVGRVGFSVGSDYESSKADVNVVGVEGGRVNRRG